MAYFTGTYTDVLREYLDYLVRLAHAHAVDTGPFLPRREGPGDEVNPDLDLTSRSGRDFCIPYKLGTELRE